MTPLEETLSATDRNQVLTTTHQLIVDERDTAVLQRNSAQAALQEAEKQQSETARALETASLKPGELEAENAENVDRLKELVGMQEALARAVQERDQAVQALEDKTAAAAEAESEEAKALDTATAAAAKAESELAEVKASLEILRVESESATRMAKDEHCAAAEQAEADKLAVAAELEATRTALADASQQRDAALDAAQQQTQVLDETEKTILHVSELISRACKSKQDWANTIADYGAIQSQSQAQISALQLKPSMLIEQKLDVLESIGKNLLELVNEQEACLQEEKAECAELLEANQVLNSALDESEERYVSLQQSAQELCQQMASERDEYKQQLAQLVQENAIRNVLRSR